MTLSASDRRKVLQNIIANGGGVDRVDLATELARVESGMGMMASQQQMAEMNAPVQPPPEQQNMMPPQEQNMV